jgi:hypothetical protein
VYIRRRAPYPPEFLLRKGLGIFEKGNGCSGQHLSFFFKKLKKNSHYTRWVPAGYHGKKIRK